MELNFIYFEKRGPVSGLRSLEMAHKRSGLFLTRKRLATVKQGMGGVFRYTDQCFAQRSYLTVQRFCRK